MLTAAEIKYVMLSEKNGLTASGVALAQILDMVLDNTISTTGQSICI